MKIVFETLFAVLMLGKDGLRRIEGFESMGVKIN